MNDGQTETKYKVKLSSGRVLGPIDLERIRRLILKNQIVGGETAREYPQGEWRDISRIPAIAELLLAKIDGRLAKDFNESEEKKYKGLRLPGADSALQPTEVLPGTELVDGTGTPSIGGLTPLPELDDAGEQDERTTVQPSVQALVMTSDPDDEKTRVATQSSFSVPDLETGASPDAGEDKSGVRIDLGRPSVDRNISTEKTVFFQRSTETTGLPSPAVFRMQRPQVKVILRSVIVAACLCLVGYELFFAEAPKKAVVKIEAIRPRLPTYIQGKSDPDGSQKLYTQAMQEYVADTVQGYRVAADRLLVSAGYDINNVKALAMLASCYLNLIDASNKDENYFAVISKLIEMSRAKANDLPETVIADVEFFVTVNKAEAAQNRIVEYTKTHQSYGAEMYFFLAYAFFHRGDLVSAARAIGQIPDNRAYSPRIFYLKGLIAEKLNDLDTAVLEYNKALKLSKGHARSQLRLADIMSRRGQLKEASSYLEFLVTNVGLLVPKEQAQAFFLHAQLNELFKKWDLALGDVEKAVRLDRSNHDYLLELYSLRTKAGDTIQAVQKQARMYYFLGEGEKLLKEGKNQDALTQFLQARQAFPDSPLPLIKTGDMFSRLHDVANARMNYELAAKRAPKDIEVWSKYIDILIQSYDWEDAEIAMEKFRSLPVSQSAIDKAAGDMYAKQGLHREAQAFYKKAMARESIDPDVYVAFAKSLVASKNFKDAPFFFALALRFDPFNIDALVGTAKAVAATESIERGISMLQDELQKGGGSKAELLAAIAELNIQRGEWGLAQQFVDQARSADPDYALPWKLQAQIDMNREGLDKDALEKALAAYKSYSERNMSDPEGYLQRYKVFTKKAEFEKASDELARIYAIYPKYPNLHYYKGQLYTIMGNHKAAIEEYVLELKNNSNSAQTMVMLAKELIELGDVRGALTQLQKAMTVNPTNPEPKHWLGYANYLLKNYQGALALYNAALADDPGNALIYKRIGLACRDMGDPVCARTNFRKYLEMEPDAPDKAEFEKYL